MLVDIIRKASEILAEEKPSDESIRDIENSLSSYLEAIATERVQESISLDELEDANRLLKEIRREKARRLADQQGESSPKVLDETPDNGNNGTKSSMKSAQLNPDAQPDSLKKFFQSSHDPEADALMDQAEEAFYRGNYQEAIPLYEKVLLLEPGWVRAQEHRGEAEEYLRTGNIPSVALPAEAGKAYGKAQSAARVFRYQIALSYLDDAFTHLEDAGIKRWREGEELRQDLDNQIQAGEVYKEGLNLLKQGDLTGALSLIQTAASAVATPEYIDKAAEIRADISLLDEVGDVITSSGEVPAEKLVETKAKLERVRLKYGDISQVKRLNNRLDLIIPSAIKSLSESIQRSIQVANTAETIIVARQNVDLATTQLQLLRQLDSSTTQVQSLVSNISDLDNKIKSYEDTVNRARKEIKSVNRFFAFNAWKMSKNIRNRFPSDPNVLSLKKELIPFWGTVTLAGIIILAIVGTLLWISIKAISSSVEERRLALTPTITPTPTLTQTPTMTLMPSLTPTPTPDYTPTTMPTFTPTPVTIGLTARTLWARNGCYESFTANGRIEEGSEVTLLPMPNRAFDDLNRECVLVEYRTTNSAIIGYILLADFVIP